jgi:hypothetical protein
LGAIVKGHREALSSPEWQRSLHLATRLPSGVLEQLGVDFFDAQESVVELRVAQDVEAPSFERHDSSQALEIPLDVVEVI